MGLHGCFAKLTDPSTRGSSNELTLAQKGRTWILITIYANLDSVFYNQVSPIDADFDLIRRQCEVLRRSSDERWRQINECLSCHAHLLGLLAKSQNDLGGREPDQVAPIIASLLSDLESWWSYWSSQGPNSPFSTKDIECAALPNRYFTTTEMETDISLLPIKLPSSSFVFLLVRHPSLRLTEPDNCECISPSYP